MEFLIEFLIGLLEMLHPVFSICEEGVTNEAYGSWMPKATVTAEEAYISYMPKTAEDLAREKEEEIRYYNYFKQVPDTTKETNPWQCSM